MRLLANFLELFLRRALIKKSREFVGRRSFFQVLNLADGLKNIRHAPQQNFRLERFANKIHCAVVEALALNFFAGVRRHEHERNFFMELILQFNLHFVARHARHSEIGENHVGLFVAINFHRLLRRLGAESFVLSREHIFRHHQRDNHIVDD